MLKAYDYSDFSFSKRELKNEELFNEEKRLAHDFVLKHLVRQTKCKCPLCDSKDVKYLFLRWDVNYYMCSECYSIFVPVEGETMDKYTALDKLTELRVSERYQQEAEKRRADIWDETLSWLRYRTYRYLGTNCGLNIVDYGNRFRGLSERIAKSELCAAYTLEKSILQKNLPQGAENFAEADVVLYMNQLQHESRPLKIMERLWGKTKKNGLLFLNTRLGSGFDILTLRGGLDNIFPYEHIMLPSKRGIEILLEKAGFETLEVTTVGSMDVQYVIEHAERIPEDNLFIKHMIQQADNTALMDFQKFLQKNGFSSFAQIIARRK